MTQVRGSNHASAKKAGSQVPADSDTARAERRAFATAGAAARNGSLTPEQRSAAASKAIRARWERHRAARAAAEAAGLPPPSPHQRQDRLTSAQPGNLAPLPAPTTAAGAAPLDRALLAWAAAWERVHGRAYVPATGEREVFAAWFDLQPAALHQALPRAFLVYLRARRARGSLADFCANAGGFLLAISDGD